MSQQNYRRENLQKSLNNVARTSQRLKNEMEKALSAYKRDGTMIKDRLTDGNLADSDYFHSGTQSATIGEMKGAIRALLSYSVHAGEITESVATTEMSEAGISDNTLLQTDEIAEYLSSLRV